MNGAWHSLRDGSIRPIEWLNETVMSQCAMLYRRPSEPQAIEVVFDAAIFIVRIRRHRLARRYTFRICAPPTLGGAKQSEIWRSPASALPLHSALPSSGLPFAIRRAAGAPARAR